MPPPSDETPQQALPPAPGMPGWYVWESLDERRFNQFLCPIIVRRVGDRAQVRMQPELRHSNVLESVHGGVVMAFADVSLFAGGHIMGIGRFRYGVTIECSVQFLGPGKLGMPLDSHVELLRETGRMAFLRGTMTQDDAKVAAFNGIVRKPS